MTGALWAFQLFAAPDVGLGAHDHVVERSWCDEGLRAREPLTEQVLLHLITPGEARGWGPRLHDHLSPVGEAEPEHS